MSQPTAVGALPSNSGFDADAEKVTRKTADGEAQTEAESGTPAAPTEEADRRAKELLKKLVDVDDLFTVIARKPDLLREIVKFL